MHDDLAVWCRVREHVPWCHLVSHTVGPVVGRRDGMVEYVRGTPAGTSCGLAACSTHFPRCVRRRSLTSR
jgi:hypothetical protein